MLWFTSDTHFGHKNVCSLCNRPFSNVDEMGEALIRRWNAVVEPNHVVWHLGDLSFSGQTKTADVLSKLNGHIHLVLGNHDNQGRCLKFVVGGLLKSVQSYKVLRHNRQKIVLSHFPFEEWVDCHKGSWHLHGHTHGNLPPRGKRLDVGVDCHAYVPVHFDTVAKWMEDRPLTPHHGYTDGEADNEE